MLNNSLNEVPITTQEYNDILNIQSTILEMIASRTKVNEILAKLCEMAEALLSNSVASIMLKDSQSGLMSVLSAPSVPEVGHQALQNLKPGPTGGSCGNAVFRNEAQYVYDTFKDERWEDLREVAYNFNLCSCWSTPVRDEFKNAIGSFALSSFEHRSPSLFHKKLLETGAVIVNIVLKNQENEQRIKLFSQSMQNASEGMMITNSENKIIEVNKAFEKIYGYSEAEVIGQNPKIFSAKKNPPEYYEKMWKSLDQDAKWSDEILNRSKDGREITQWLSISKILADDEKEASNYLAIFTDLTELKSTQKLLQDAAFKDRLTQLPNKAQLDKQIDSAKEQTLILLNVNNFSYINTAYGFEIGDKLLVTLASILDEKLFAGITYRINSDEFGLLFDAKVDIALQVQKVKSYFYATEITIDEIKLNVSFTYGACCGTEHLLRNASSALKSAKQKDRNHLCIFSEDLFQNKERDAFIKSNTILYRALAEDKIVPYYQGIRDNLTKKINKYEVLARIDYNGEIITPNKFLEPARLSGVLPEITKIMIEKSFAYMADTIYEFSINITEEDLVREYLLGYLDEKSKKYKIDPSRVILEILEGVSSDGKTSHIQQLNALKDAGYNLAIDDFGSEYSNFERVLELDIDYLKIDARYIKDIDVNKKSYEITRAIVFFAKTAKIPCIAEFVHNQSVQAIVDELDINFSQGYYFSEPQATI